MVVWIMDIWAKLEEEVYTLQFYAIQAYNQIIRPRDEREEAELTFA